MTDTESRLRAALHEVAEGDAPRPRPVDVAGFRRARRVRLGAGAASVAAVAAAAALLVPHVGAESGPAPAEPASTWVSRPALVKELSVSCGVGGDVSLNATEVQPMGDGLHVSVVGVVAGGSPLTLEYTLADGTGGGLAVTATPTTHVLDVPPGEIFVACADPATADRKTVSVNVVDRIGFYEPGDPVATLGCHFTGTADGPTTTGATGMLAAQAWRDAYAPDGTLSQAPGYVEDPARDWLLESPEEPGLLQVFASDDGGFTAGLGPIC